MQQGWDQQVAVSYLLGLDAHIPQEFQEVRTQEKVMAELRKAAKEGGLGPLFRDGGGPAVPGSPSPRLLAHVRLAEQIASFNVVPEYGEYEGARASILTRTISVLNDENTIDREPHPSAYRALLWKVSGHPRLRKPRPALPRGRGHPTEHRWSALVRGGRLSSGRSPEPQERHILRTRSKRQRRVLSSATAHASSLMAAVARAQGYSAIGRRA